MRQALELAAQADHRTSPNPMVGAVLFSPSGEQVGSGWHERAGSPHAEAMALGEAGERARGAILVVTLEPCAHRGRTPPCVDAIIAAGVARVVVAAADPDQRVRGEGLRRLREAGVEVTLGVAEAEARRLNEFYIKHRETGLPFVSIKFAASLDGRIATRRGDSRWISGEEARAHAHRLRHQHDAVLVGVGTVLRDDPQLTARFPGARQPLRVVLDSHARTPPQARVRDSAAETIFVADGRDLPAVLGRLASRGVLSVLVEGGGAVHGSFFDAGLVDRVHAYLSPLIIGGEDAKAAVGGRGAERISEALRLERVETTLLGGDVLVSGYAPRRREGN